MAADHLTSTSIHEAAHATISHVIGEEIEYMEITGERDGITMPFHSPCRLCGSAVPEGQACPECFRYYGKNRPSADARSADINRAYRIEAAVAAAGELAEAKFNNGVLLASEEELEDDRDRVSSRASLRHLWQGDSCANYCCADADCPTCERSAEELRAEVRNLLNDETIWAGITGLAEHLKTAHRRLSGAEVRRFLEDRGVTFASHPIDSIWPPLP